MSKLTRTESLHSESEPRLLPKPTSPKPASAGRPPLPHAWMMPRPASANVRGRGAGARGVQPLSPEIERRLQEMMRSLAGFGAYEAPPPPPPPPPALKEILQNKLKPNFVFNQPHLRGVESRGRWLAAAGRNRRGTSSAALPTRKARSPRRSKLNPTRKRSASKNRSK
jgi:hypothetical protein